MKRVLPFLFLIFLFFGNCFKATAQEVGYLHSMVYYGGTHFGTYNIFDPAMDTDYAPFDFTGPNGQEPYGNLIQTKSGLIYGMTPYGGTTGGGVIFSYDIRKKLQTILYNFDYTDTSKPSIPYGTLLLASDGYFYAVAFAGGAGGSGTLFKFDPTNNSVTNLYTMYGRNIGYYSTSNFIQVNDSLLYSMTGMCRAGNGTIFNYNIKSGIATECFVFNGTDGGFPRGTLLQVNDSLLYGLTQQGGTAGLGVLFKYNFLTNTETVVHNFTGNPDGSTPGGTLIKGTDGYLYGVTQNGGTNDSGTLFRFDPNLNYLTVLHSFYRLDGEFPWQGVIQASDGKLYGNCNIGGNRKGDTSASFKLYGGTIFSYDLGTNTFKMCYSYNIANGINPYGDFLEVMSARDSVVQNKCPGGTSGSIAIITRGAIPPLTYTWSNGATTSSITGLGFGVYTGTVTDSRGISFTFIDSIGPAPIGVSFIISNPCSGGSGGVAIANVAGGTGPFSFSWSNGNTTDTATNLSVGTYTCTIIDANGCPSMGSVTITQAAPMHLDSLVCVPQTCPTCSNGQMTAYISGGIPPGDSNYYFSIWSNGSHDTLAVSHLDSGYYSVCITSPYGCGSICDSCKIITAVNNINTPNALLNVYPVPSTGQASINLTGSGYENLEITDALGREVYTQLLSPDKKDDKLLINLSGQPDGVYILRVNSRQEVLTGKIIIQK